MKHVARSAKLSDIDAIVDLAMESVKNDPLPVRADREAMREEAQLMLNPAHFMWVSELEGVVVAAVVACVQRSFWYRGLQASVTLYYGRAPGVVMPLIRELARWMKARSGIKVGVMELEPNADPRLIKALKRIGFTRTSANISYVRMS